MKLVKLISILLLSTVILSGCGLSRSADNQKEQSGKFVVVTSFYPMYISTINITKDISGVEVINMTKAQTGCLHDYQLSPGDLKTLEKAGAFVINGAGMESFLDKVIRQKKDLKIIEASKGMEIIRNSGGEENPHVWVSVSDNMLQVRNIAEQLAGIDAANAAKYRDNAEVYVKKLEALREKMHKAIDPLKNKDIITFHEAFPYFAKEFGLRVAAVVEREPGSEPVSKELEETIKIVRDAKIKALFAEPQYSSKSASIIAKETGAKVHALDPVVTGDAKPGAYDDYIKIMEQNMRVLQEALK